MNIYSKDGLLLDVLVKETTVSIWRESNRLLIWVHASSREVWAAKEMLGLEVIPIVLPATRDGLVKIIMSKEVVPISGDIIYLN